MISFSKKQYGIGALLLAILIAFSFGWKSVAYIIEEKGTIGWGIPMMWFSLGMALLSLMAFFTTKKSLIWLVSVLSFFPGIWFVVDPLFILGSMLGSGLCVAGILRIQQDMQSHMNIRAYRGIQNGSGWLTIAFSLTIALFYFVSVRSESGEVLLQRLSVGRVSDAVILKALGWMNPDFKVIDRKEVTVDEFLLSFQKKQTGDDSINNLPSDEDILRTAGITASDPRSPQVLARVKQGWSENAVVVHPQQLILEQSRKQLSDIAGETLTGNEPIAVVLSRIVEQRVQSTLQPTVAQGSGSMLAFLLALIVFLTLLSFGAILAIAWRAVATIFFVLLRRVGIIEVSKIMVEKEVLV